MLLQVSKHHRLIGLLWWSLMLLENLIPFQYIVRPMTIKVVPTIAGCGVKGIRIP
jgi:hypothetical protein